MESVFLFMVMVAMFGGIGLLWYKYRASFQKWLHDPQYGSSWYPDRKVILQRKIEDAKAEMEWLDEKREAKALNETKSETGG